MSQPYGQQPGNPNQPDSGGYQQPGGYPQGGMPAAPQEYGQAPTTRPGSVTAAAVLGFVQAGITLIAAIIMMLALGAISSVSGTETVNGVEVDKGALTEFWIASVVAVIGAALLIWASVKLLSGTAGNLFLIAMGLQILLCAYWLFREAGIIPIVLVVMPVVALVLVLTGTGKQWLASKSGR